MSDLQDALDRYDNDDGAVTWSSIATFVEAARLVVGAQRIVNEQAEDDGLWFVAVTAPEAYLQQELRRLHAAIEEATKWPDWYANNATCSLRMRG